MGPAGRDAHGCMGVRGKDEDPTQRPTPALPAYGDVDPGETQHHRLGRFRLTRFGSGLSEQGSAQGELSSASPIGEQSVVTQPVEAAREYMLEEVAGELAGVERHDLDLVAVGARRHRLS